MLISCFLLPSSSAENGNDLIVQTSRIYGDSNEWQFKLSGQIRGKEIGELIENEIGAGNYQLSTVLLNTCHSGAGLGTLGGALSGPYRIVTGCSTNQTVRVRFNLSAGTVSGFFPALFESVLADPNDPLSSHVNDGKNADPRFPKDAEKE